MEENIGCVRRDRAAAAAMETIEQALRALTESTDPAVAGAVSAIRSAVDTLKE